MPTDFIDSFLKLDFNGDDHHDLDVILDNIAIVPSFEDRPRGKITIFKNNHKSMFEDPLNLGLKVISVKYSNTLEAA